MQLVATFSDNTTLETQPELAKSYVYRLMSC